ncbi:unnamed protein product, partial [Meganyctiphanes norvegica]
KIVFKYSQINMTFSYLLSFQCPCSKINTMTLSPDDDPLKAVVAAGVDESPEAGLFDWPKNKLTMNNLPMNKLPMNKVRMNELSMYDQLMNKLQRNKAPMDKLQMNKLPLNKLLMNNLPMNKLPMNKL